MSEHDMHIKDSFAISRASTKPVVEIDFARYFECTRDFDMSEEEQRQLILALHKIMLAFVDLGFELNPIQHAGEGDHIACGQSESEVDLSTQPLGDVVRLLASKDENLNTAFRESSEGESVS